MSDQDNGEQFVNEAYKKYDTMSPTELVRAMHAIRQVKDTAEEELKVINAEFDFLRMVKIPKAFEDHGLELLKIEGIGRCNLTGDLQASIATDKKDEAFQWLRDTGRGDLIQPTVNSSTLKAAIKALMQKGDQVPDCFRVHIFTRASITKG